MNYIVLLALLVLATLVSAGSKYGYDLSTYCDENTCLKQNGYSFAIPRCWESGGRLDPNCLSNLKNAKSAGMSPVDCYMFPCVPCGNPTQQMDDLIADLGGEAHRIWIDVEVYEWSSSLSSNQNFIKSLIEAGQKKGVKMGIYSSYYNWQSIVGVSYDYPEQQGLPLWYAHYDNNPSFNDYVEFGGWKNPTIKQYDGDATECSTGIDKNWSPSY